MIPQQKPGPYELDAVIGFDCTDDDAKCVLLEIPDDPPSTLPNGNPSTFTGYADPCVRSEIFNNNDTKKLWMTYSWPFIHRVGLHAVTGIATHLASSSDGGHTWNFRKNLWEPEPMTFEGEEGFLDHEVSNILPVKSAAGQYWLGARLNYFLPNEGGVNERPAITIHIQLFKSKTIEGLSTSQGLKLGSDYADKEIEIDINLNKLTGKKEPGFWTEPALYYDGQSAYLALRIATYKPGTQIPTLNKDEVYVFSFNPDVDISEWELHNEGVLAGHAEAMELDGDALTQIEITKSRSGQLLLLATSMKYDPSLPAGIQQYIHEGIYVMEIESLSPPKLKRTVDDQLVIRAKLNASDNDPSGPGASGYDPNSESGIFMVKRDFSYSMKVEIRKTNVVISSIRLKST